MDIGRGNFQILSPEQANPGINMMSKVIAQRLQNQYMQSQTQGQNLTNQRNQATLPYAGPQAAADLQASNLSNEWYAPEKRALINQNNASAQNMLAQAIAQRINNQYLPQKNQQDLTSSSLANQLAQSLMPTQIQQAKSNLDASNIKNQGAQAKLPYIAPQAAANLAGTNLQNQASQATLPYAGPQAAAQQALTQAQAKYYGQGSGPGSQRNVNQQLLVQAENEVGNDNPNIANDPIKVREALNAYATGSRQLKDGTILNPPTAVTLNKMGAWAKSPTTAALVTQNVKSNQAAAEIPALSAVIDKYTAPYGSTLFGRSPKEIQDSFSSNPEDQIKLGQFAGAQALQYELAQIRNKQVGGESGEKATHELMTRGNQLIKTWYPRMSAAGRKATMDTIQEGLDAAFNARKQTGINAIQTLPGYTDNNDKISSNNKSDDDKIASLMKQYPNVTKEQFQALLKGENI